MITVLNLNYSYLLCSASLTQIASRQQKIFEADKNILVSCLLYGERDIVWGYYLSGTGQRKNEETIQIPVCDSAMRIKQFNNWINISEWVATFAIPSLLAMAMCCHPPVPRPQIWPGVYSHQSWPTRELLTISHTRPEEAQHLTLNCAVSSFLLRQSELSLSIRPPPD